MVLFVVMAQSIVTVAMAQVTPVGNEFAINAATTNWQWDSKAASAGDGSFVVVWTDGWYDAVGQDGSVAGIQGRRFDQDGTPLSNEFQVNTTTLGIQFRPAIAMNEAGEFVVVWAHYLYSQNEASIQAQRFDADANRVGSELQINTFEPGVDDPPTNPEVALGPGGPFIVVWQVNGPEPVGDTDSWHVRGRLYDSNGNPLTDDMRVNTYTTGSQCCALVGMANDGRFTVVYEDGYIAYGPLSRDGSATGQFAQQFNADGSFRGADFQVHTYTTGDQYAADMAMDPQGNFIVTWTDYGLVPPFNGQDGSGAGIFGQKFDKEGGRVGGEFQVNANTAFGQFYSTVEYSGSFVVAWESYFTTGNDFSYTSIQARHFDDLGVAEGPEFQVNSYATGVQYWPTVASAKNGTFVVAWSDRGLYPSYTGQDGSLSGVQAQRFTSPNIFDDGFESGDTSVWSASLP